MNISIILMTALVSATASAQGKAVPVEEEPQHKAVLKVDYVKVLRGEPRAGAKLFDAHAHE